MSLIQKIGFVLMICPALAQAEWSVITHTDTENNSETQVAYTQNEEGYSLEIYKDNGGAIRSRFSLGDTLDMFAKRSCPTYQIDTSLPDNRSINDAPCLTDLVWSEFILGYTQNYIVSSKKLNALMNGSVVTFRFMLENGTYNETHFSLIGSKRATYSALGPDISVLP